MKQQQIVDFMIAKLGGESAVMGEFYGYRLSEMAAAKFTLADVWAEAKRDGWLDYLEHMTLTDLMRILIPSPGEKAPAATRNKYSQQDGRDHDAQILAFLTDNPWSSRPQVLDAIPVNAVRLTRRMYLLKQKGEIIMKGERNTARYAVGGEPTKPTKRKARPKGNGKLIGTTEAAAYVGRTRSTLLYYIAKGDGPPKAKGSSKYVFQFWTGDLDAWLKDHPVHKKKAAAMRKRHKG